MKSGDMKANDMKSGGSNMKAKKRTALIITSLLLIILVVSACTSKSDMSENSVQSNAAAEDAGSAEMGVEEDSSSDTDPDYEGIEPEKVITSIHLSLETTEFDSAIKDLNGTIKKNKGYIEDSHISSKNRINNKTFKGAEYTIRIPKDNANNFINEIDSVGNIVSQSTSKEDITKQYYDTESRLNLLETKEKRMTALLEKAEKMEDIISIENHLSEIIHQKENLTKNIQDMDHKVSYNIVHVNISEVEKLGSNITTKTTFAAKISDTFSNSLYMFQMFMEGFVLVFIYVLPFLLVGGLAVFLVLKLIRAKKRTDKD